MSRSLALLCVILLAACASVLGIKAPSAERPFEHRAHLVKGVNCLECHRGVETAGDEGDLHLPSVSSCTRCHSRPHDPRPCGGCHGDSHTRAESELAKKHLRFAHEKHLGSVKGQCVPCHSLQQTTLRPPMAQCFTCHQHEGQWRARDCDGCHVDLPSELSLPASHVVHEGDFVREHGIRAASARDLCATCHSERQCASCHGVSAPVLPWRLAFDRPALTGLHRAGLRDRHADEARAAPGLCQTCHQAERFCSDCHEQKNLGKSGKSPHPINWVRAAGGEHGRAARMEPASCASCHGGAGEALCVGCHKVGAPGGNPHGPGFSSPLDRFRDVPCRQCHAP